MDRVMRLYRAAGIGVVSVLIVLLLGAAGSMASALAPLHLSTPTDARSLTASPPKIQYTIPLGKIPSGGALDTRNGNVFVSNEGSNNVTVVNATTHAHSTIKVGTSPSGLIYDPDNGDVYVPNLNSSSVSIINGATDKVTATVKLGSGAHPSLAQIDPANGNVLVFNNATFPSPTTAWMIKNTTHAVTKLTLGLGLIIVGTYSPASKDMYYPDYFSSTVTAISPSGALTNISVPGPPVTLVYNPAGKVIVVGLGAVLPTLPSIDWISSGNVAGTPAPLPSNVTNLLIPTGGYDPYNGRTYLIGYNITANQSYAISILPPATFAGLTLLGTGPDFYLGYVDPANHDLFFGSAGVDNVTVLDNSSKLAKTIATSQPTSVMVYDPSTKQMFVSGIVNLKTKSKLYAITPGLGVSSLTVGKEAIPFAYDPVDTYVYVANVGSDSLDIVS